MKKIFVAGPRVVKKLDNKVKIKLKSFIDYNFTILVGDANGVDRLIQEFYSELGYNNINVYASNGITKENNLGIWRVVTVDVDKSVKGFEFYAQKDIAMARDSDMGFMIWNGKSKGTLNNMINLIKEGKEVLLFLAPTGNFYKIKTDIDLINIVNICSYETKKLYNELSKKRTIEKGTPKNEQISMPMTWY